MKCMFMYFLLIFSSLFQRPSSHLTISICSRPLFLHGKVIHHRCLSSFGTSTGSHGWKTSEEVVFQWDDELFWDSWVALWPVSLGWPHSSMRCPWGQCSCVLTTCRMNGVWWCCMMLYGHFCLWVFYRLSNIHFSLSKLLIGVGFLIMLHCRCLEVIVFLTCVDGGPFSVWSLSKGKHGKATGRPNLQVVGEGENVATLRPKLLPYWLRWKETVFDKLWGANFWSSGKSLKKQAWKPVKHRSLLWMS